MGSESLQPAGMIAQPSAPDPEDYGYGQRADGSYKGPGFLGPLKRPDGDVSTELSVGVNFDGQEREVPLLVPTLSQAEIDHLLRDGQPTDAMVDKAVAHARQRIKEGKSPFFGRSDETPATKLYGGRR